MKNLHAPTCTLLPRQVPRNLERERSVPSNRCEYMVVEVPAAGVYVVRFTRPDLSEQLCADGDSVGCELFQQLTGQVRAGLAARETLVLNLGLVEPFPTAFFRYLLKVREVVNERQARLMPLLFAPTIGAESTFEDWVTTCQCAATAIP